MKKTVETDFAINDLKAIKIAGKLLDLYQYNALQGHFLELFLKISTDAYAYDVASSGRFFQKR